MYFTLFVCVIAALLAWWYKRRRGVPPGPRGLPVCGVIPFMTRRPEIKFYQWSKEYGPVISVRVARQEWIVLNSYDAIMEAMLRQGQKFVGRPSNYILDIVFQGKNKGIIFSSGDIWEVNRKFGNGVFRLFGVGKRSFESSVQEEVTFLLQNIEKTNGIPQEWRSDVQKAVTNVICRVIFGKRFEYTHKIFVNAMEGITGDPWKGSMLNMAILLPFLRFFPLVNSVITEMIKYRDEAYACFAAEIARHKSKIDSSDVQDFIDAFLVEQNREREEIGQNVHFSDEQLTTYIGDFFGAGSETSSSTLLWCLLGFLNFPQHQEKIQTEIRSTIGDDTPSMTHRDSMPFTQAYIHEIQRYCTLAPLALPHCASEDAEINGYTIPKGTQVVVNIWAPHNDPENFENPGEFLPERFLDAEDNFVRSKYVIPFLVGPRHCLGEQLAKMEIFIFLTSILQKFKIKLDPTSSNQLPAMDDGVLGAAYVPKPFKAIFVPVD